jgi:hypothetical protein
MHISFKIIKTLFHFYSARHVSDTTLSIIRSFLLLYMQSLVNVWCWVSCCFQQGWKKQPIILLVIFVGVSCGGLSLSMTSF